MRLPLPASISSTISESAMRKAREDMRGRSWKSMNAIRPYSGEGFVGLRSTLKYLMYQDRGTRPRVMWELEGKTIPMQDESGLHFVKAVGVGQPGYVTLPGGVKVWREQKWKHPGIKPKRFLENSITASITESHDLIQQSMMKILTGVE